MGNLWVGSKDRSISITIPIREEYGGAQWPLIGDYPTGQIEYAEWPYVAGSVGEERGPRMLSPRRAILPENYNFSLCQLGVSLGTHWARDSRRA